MDTLQLQDAFKPYYAKRPRDDEEIRRKELTDGDLVSASAARDRLERCRSRLAHIVSSSDASQRR